MPSPVRMLSAARLDRLARAAGTGDRRAFVKLYRALHRSVFAFVARRISDPSDVEDLTARVFHRLVEHLPRFDPSRGSVRGWVMTMARNAIIDHVRAMRRHESVDDAQAWLADATLLPSRALEDDETKTFVRALLADLPAATREIVALRYGDDLRHREIAQMLGMTEAAVKQRLSRIVRELRRRSNEFSVEQGVKYAL